MKKSFVSFWSSDKDWKIYEAHEMEEMNQSIEQIELELTMLRKNQGGIYKLFRARTAKNCVRQQAHHRLQICGQRLLRAA